MKSQYLLFGLCVFGAVAAASAQCSIELTGNDAMQFSTKQIVVPASCNDFTIHLKNAGKMPKAAMGHNVVVAKTSDLNGVIADGLRAGVGQDFVKTGDVRVLGKTKLLGAGESASVKLNVAKLKAAPHSYVCTFPGHSGMMRGKIVVK